MRVWRLIDTANEDETNDGIEQDPVAPDVGTDRHGSERELVPR